jgi:predicted DNA-binding transcriptional regulator AlpA
MQRVLTRFPNQKQRIHWCHEFHRFLPISHCVYRACATARRVNLAVFTLIGAYFIASSRSTYLRFMSRGEIAAYLGVSLGAVKPYRDFPPPDVSIGRNMRWSRQTVDEWLAKRHAKRRGPWPAPKV